MEFPAGSLRLPYRTVQYLLCCGRIQDLIGFFALAGRGIEQFIFPFPPPLPPSRQGRGKHCYFSWRFLCLIPFRHRRSLSCVIRFPLPLREGTKGGGGLNFSVRIGYIENKNRCDKYKKDFFNRCSLAPEGCLDPWIIG